MSNTTLKLVRNYDDDIDTDGNGVATATLRCEVAAPKRAQKPGGPPCEKCQTPLESEVVTLCKECGWYPSLGIYVEVDSEWESAVDREQPAEATPQPSHVQVWLNLVPRWGWVIVASVIAIIAESVVARLATPTGSVLRMYWSLFQLVIGVGVAINCHVLNFLSQAADDADVGLMDLFLRPVRLWAQSCRLLPRRLMLVDGAVCGVVAATMSVVVIGGLPYERLWDWGFKAPPKQDLMGAVMDRVKELDNDTENKELEDSVKDFAGQQDLTDKANSPPKPRQSADCVILGYQLDGDGQLAGLVLGTTYHSELVFAGRVAPKLTADEANVLVESLKEVTTDRPLVAVGTMSAFWVQPKFTCRVTSSEQTKAGQLRNMEWDQLLSTMDLAK